MSHPSDCWNDEKVLKCGGRPHIDVWFAFIHSRRTKIPHTTNQTPLYLHVCSIHTHTHTRTRKSTHTKTTPVTHHASGSIADSAVSQGDPGRDLRMERATTTIEFHYRAWSFNSRRSFFVPLVR